MIKTIEIAMSLLAFLASSAAFGSQDVIRDEISGAGFKLIFDSTAVGNLSFQLDCMANLIHCDEAAISPLWKTAGWTSEDDSALREWGELQEKYSGLEVPLPEVSKEELRKIGYPLRHRGVSFDQKFRIIELTAADLKEFRREAGVLMRAEDADKAVSILHRFEPRFEKWWQDSGSKNARSFVGSFAVLMKKNGVTALLEKSVTFYKSRLPESAEVFVHFIPLSVSSGHTSGEQIENHGLVEFLSTEKPEDRIDVICHEIFHYFYSMASTQDHVSLVSYFVKSGFNYGIPAYNLLNESLATAFGNGMVARAVHDEAWFQKMLSKERSFYNDSAIDKVSKALLPELDQDLGSQVTLYNPSFLGKYLKTVGNVLGDDRNAIQLFLRTSAVFYEREFRSEYRNFQRKTHSGSSWDTSDPDSDLAQGKLAGAPHLSGLILIRPTSLGILNRWKALIPASKIKEIGVEAKRNKNFVYSVERAKDAWIFVVVASSGEEAGKLLAKLADVRKPFVGLRPWR